MTLRTGAALRRMENKRLYSETESGSQENEYVAAVSLRWLPRVITNIVLIERELENET